MTGGVEKSLKFDSWKTRHGFPKGGGSLSVIFFSGVFAVSFRECFVKHE